MRIIYQNTTDPYFNLALEEYLLRQCTGDIFMLWINSPCIVVGRNQNTLAEVNYDYVREHQIPVVRRQTGGGAVFHDLGNVNYTFIEEGGADNFSNYALYCRPIIEVLNSLGVPAELSGRNDLLIDGKKFSGTAQCAYHGRMMHHGCIMFNANVNNLADALRVNPLKIQSKGIKSVRSRVTNIAEHLPSPLSMEEFCDRVLRKIETENPGSERYALTPDDIAAVKTLREEKYATWEWNVGYKKEYSFHKDSYFPAGLLDVRMNIANDQIGDVRIYGDYFGRRDVSEVEQALCGAPYTPEALRSRLEPLELAEYFSGITIDELLTAFF